MSRVKGTELMESGEVIARPAGRSAAAGGEGAGPRLAVGDVLAHRYELTEKLGEGAMGLVFAARDRELDEAVAVKVLHPDVAGDAPDALARFRREVKLARRVTHKNVARTFELGEDPRGRFITMELVRGETLARLLLRERKLAPARALPLLSAICEALDAAHGAGVVHCDVKPDNVIVEVGGRVVVTDFGIASVAPTAALHADESTSSGGTPAYIAPEQLGEGPITGRADLYALGVVMFEVLTGQRPWVGETVRTVVVSRLTDAPRDPSVLEPGVDPALAQVILRCMSRAPEDRYATALEVRDALRSAIAAPSARHVPDAAPSGRGLPRAHDSGAKSIAVLPLAAPEAHAAAAAAFSEDLADALASVRGLSVLSNAAVAKRVASSPDVVPAALGVDYVVSGTLRDSPPDVRLTVRLVEAATDRQTWTQRFDVNAGRILSVADRAAPAIAHALGLDGGVTARGAPTDPVVVDLYLRAKQAYRVFSSEAATLLDAAIAHAPDNAVLHSFLAMALLRIVFRGNVDPSLVTRAHRAAERAIELAPELGEPHLARAHVLLHTGEPAAAARAAREAVAKAPSLADAHELLGRLLVEAGRGVDGLRRHDVAIRLDPDLIHVPWDRIRLAALEGEWERAHRLLSAQPTGPDGALAYRIRYASWRRAHADLEELAVEFARRKPELTPLVAELEEAVLHAYTGKGPIAPALARFDAVLSVHLIGVRPRQWVLQLKAEAAGFAGETGVLLDTLEEGDRAGLFDVLWLEQCPLLAGARSDPRYDAIRGSVRARADTIVDAVWG